MSADARQSATINAVRRIAIVGNPNTGKTTLFNALTGLHHKVGNYPGVTVERREARLSVARDGDVTLVDLPGSYSLVPRSTDERVTRDVLLGFLQGEDPVDGVIVVVDASNLERHLYLATQIIDLGFAVVVACNMIDVARANGLELDIGALAECLGVPVVGTVGNRRTGIAELEQILPALGSAMGCTSRLDLPAALTSEADRVARHIRASGWGHADREGFLALLLLASAGVETSEAGAEIIPPTLTEQIDGAIVRLRAAGITEPDRVVIQSRYEHCRRLVSEVLCQSRPEVRPLSDRLDRVVTHPILGLGIFSSVMFVMFVAIFSGAEPLMDGIESALDVLGGAIASGLEPGTLRSLLVDGVIGGVGAVVVFLPQICILFFFICLLEDTGYMARAAVVMNRVMTRVGLPGKSFIPLISSFACAIPGIMATRTIENQRDRFVTILIAPFMSCSARLPVYIIVVGAVFAGNVWLKAGVMFAMYVLGILAALGVALVLKRTVFRAPPTGFIIELPPYRRPQMRTILRAMWERSVLFLKDAGSIIFAVSIVLWALAYFPRADQQAGANHTGQLQQSYMGRMGRVIEPVIEPLGFDWKIGVGLVASFAAREVFVSTMGIVYGIGDETDEASEPLREKMAADTWPDGKKVFTPLTGISLMVFYVLACQCISTLGVVRRETNSWRWPVAMFGYMTALAYAGSFIVYQAGSLLGWAG